MNRRRGSSLVELMMCMTAGSTLMLVAIGLVHQTLTVSSQASQQVDHDRTLARLATQFRRDAHAATEASADAETELRLSLSDETEVIYAAADRKITRRHELASGEVENETFALDDKHSATFPTQSERDRAELLIRRDTGLHSAGRRVALHVVAAVNKLPWAEQGGEETEP